MIRGRRPRAPTFERHSPLDDIDEVGEIDASELGADVLSVVAEEGVHLQDARVYSHYGPIGRRPRGYILTTDQSDAGRAGILSRRTNRTQAARVYSHDGPIGRRPR
eukprot:625339-Prorocentrum_minimum.AAC.2